MKKIDNDLYIRLGKTLRDARKTKGLSLSQVGELVDKHKATIMRYEQGQSRVDMDTLTALCNVYGITLNDLPKSDGGKDFDDRLIKAYHQSDLKTQKIIRQLLDMEEQE